MYESPIEKIYGEIQTQIEQEDEKMVMKAIRNVGVTVDKEELIKALQYDRNQYTKGYEDGKNDVLDKIRAEILKISSYEGFELGRVKDGYRIAMVNVLNIIDKYKADSLAYAISSLKTDEAYQIMYEGGEVFTKADIVNMLEKLTLEIEELDSRAGYDGGGMPTFSTDYIRKKKVNELVQQKINALKVEREVKDSNDD